MDLSDPFVDVSELILQCRDEKTKLFLGEAIVCYKAGAFRQAVVFDFIAKLRELDLAGDKNASPHLTDLEHIYLEKDPHKAIALAQAFERTLLDTAKDQFELLSSLQ